MDDFFAVFLATNTNYHASSMELSPKPSGSMKSLSAHAIGKLRAFCLKESELHVASHVLWLGTDCMSACLSILVPSHLHGATRTRLCSDTIETALEVHTSGKINLPGPTE
jgi:hypothetical protein